MARLFRVIVPVSDIEQAASFYYNVLGVKGKRLSSGRHYFELEGCTLACYDPLSDRDNLGQGWLHHEKQYIYIAVKNLDATFIRVKNSAAEIASEIKTMPWGERLFYAHDPFGNPLCFVDEKTVAST